MTTKIEIALTDAARQLANAAGWEELSFSSGALTASNCPMPGDLFTIGNSQLALLVSHRHFHLKDSDSIVIRILLAPVPTE